MHRLLRAAELQSDARGQRLLGPNRAKTARLTPNRPSMRPRLRFCSAALSAGAANLPSTARAARRARPPAAAPGPGGGDASLARCRCTRARQRRRPSRPPFPRPRFAAGPGAPLHRPATDLHSPATEAPQTFDPYDPQAVPFRNLPFSGPVPGSWGSRSYRRES